LVDIPELRHLVWGQNVREEAEYDYGNIYSKTRGTRDQHSKGKHCTVVIRKENLAHALEQKVDTRASFLHDPPGHLEDLL